MALQNAFGDLSLEATQQEIKTLTQAVNDLNETLVALGSEVLGKMPRRDASDRVTTRIEAIDSNLTLTNLSILSAMGGGQSVTNFIPFQTGALCEQDLINNNLTIT